LVSVVVSVAVPVSVVVGGAVVSVGAVGAGAGAMSGLVGVCGDAMPGWVAVASGEAGGVAVWALAVAAHRARAEPAIIKRIISLSSISEPVTGRNHKSWPIN
jgi:hypothetical protein